MFWKQKWRLLHYKCNRYDIVWFIVLLVFILGWVTSANKKQIVQIQLSITNTFSGLTSLLSPGFLSGGTIYVPDTTVDLLFSASTGGTFIAEGDILAPLIWLGTGNYNVTWSVVLSGNDGEKLITSEYNVGLEVFVANTVSVILDQTSPSLPTLLTPNLSQKITSINIYFSRSPSTDHWAWLKEYHLVINKDPSFVAPTIFTTTQISLQIDKSLLPRGRLYRYVIAEDNVGNTAQTAPLYFILSEWSNNSSSGPPGSSGPGNSGTWSTTNTTWSITIPDDTDDPLIAKITAYTKSPFDIKAYIRKTNIWFAILNEKKSQLHQAPWQNPYEFAIIPWYLQKTWANPREVIEQLHILAQAVTDPEQKIYLYTIIHYLVPGWTGGMYLLLFVLCYDIELYKRWYLLYISSSWKREKSK